MSSMISFYRVNTAINSLENSKRAFDDKINMLNDVKTRIYTSWKTGEDRDKACMAIESIQSRCREGRDLCAYAIEDARNAVNAAQKEKNRREQEARLAKKSTQR